MRCMLLWRKETGLYTGKNRGIRFLTPSITLDILNANPGSLVFGCFGWVDNVQLMIKQVILPCEVCWRKTALTYPAAAAIICMALTPQCGDPLSSWGVYGTLDPAAVSKSNWTKTGQRAKRLSAVRSPSPCRFQVVSRSRSVRIRLCNLH